MTSLRDVFDSLLGGSVHDPTGLLREHGFDLTDTEVADALVSYSHTAPEEVAAHLAPYVMAHSPVPLGDGPVPDGLELLATAPVAVPAEDVDLDDLAGGGAVGGGAEAAGGTPPAADPLAGSADDLDFGAGGRGVAGDATGAGSGPAAGGGDAAVGLDGGAGADSGAAGQVGFPLDDFGMGNGSLDLAESLDLPVVRGPDADEDDGLTGL
jgi:hypothetical protein